MGAKKVVRRTASVEVVKTKQPTPRTVYQVWYWSPWGNWIQVGPGSYPRNFEFEDEALDAAKGYVISRLVKFTLI